MLMADKFSEEVKLITNKSNSNLYLKVKCIKGFESYQETWMTYFSKLEKETIKDFSLNKVTSIYSRIIAKEHTPHRNLTSIYNNKEGKPYLFYNANNCLEIYNVSITHTENVVGVAINYYGHIGLDIESVRERTSYFKDWINLNSNSDIYKKIELLEFSDISKVTLKWTIKEALIKYTGKSIKEVNRFEIVLTKYPQFKTCEDTHLEIFGANAKSFLGQVLIECKITNVMLIIGEKNCMSVFWT